MRRFVAALPQTGAPTRRLRGHDGGKNPLVSAVFPRQFAAHGVRPQRLGFSVTPAIDDTGGMTEHGRSRDELSQSWLVRLRFAAVAGQAVAVIVAGQVLHVRLPTFWLWMLIGAALLSNVYLSLAWRRRPASQGLVAAVLAFDVVVLTGLLYLTGGPFNPFSFLYLVYISLATVLLRARLTWALVALSLVCSALLFMGHVPLEVPSAEPATAHGAHMHPGHGHGSPAAQATGDPSEHMGWHLWGMWVAFGVAAAYIVYAQIRVLSALARRDDELAEARERAARQERVVSLATLAGGAAHELASPLSTIAVVAGEMERELVARAAGEDLVEDMRVIRAQIAECRLILDQMAAQAGTSAGEELSRARVSELVGHALAGIPDRPRVERDLGSLGDAELAVTRRALEQALRVLVRNAQDASPEDKPVQLRVSQRGDDLAFDVSDQGVGMSADVLARAGEPFFTTKPPGKGLGLGLFLCRAVIESLGGKFDLRSQHGQGTTASILIPTRQVTPSTREGA